MKRWRDCCGVAERVRKDLIGCYCVVRMIGFAKLST